MATKTEETIEEKNDVDMGGFTEENQAQDSQNSPKYRYSCPSCTGTAFTSSNKDEFTEKVCSVCGNPVKYDANNYIEL